MQIPLRAVASKDANISNQKSLLWSNSVKKTQRNQRRQACEDVGYLDEEEVAEQRGHGEGDDKLSGGRLGTSVSSGFTTATLRTHLAELTLYRWRTIELRVNRSCSSNSNRDPIRINSILDEILFLSWLQDNILLVAE